MMIRSHRHHRTNIQRRQYLSTFLLWRLMLVVVLINAKGRIAEREALRPLLPHPNLRRPPRRKVHSGTRSRSSTAILTRRMYHQLRAPGLYQVLENKCRMPNLQGNSALVVYGRSLTSRHLLRGDLLVTTR